MSERRCVYTVLTGGYEQLLEQPIARRSDVDLICFTDTADLTSDHWQIRRFDPPLPQDPTRSSRRPKLLAHEYLPDHDVSLYIDNTVLLLGDPNEIIDSYLGPDASMAMFRHSYRDTVRDEFEVVVASGLDAPWVCHEQLAHYDATDPGSLTERPLWGAMIFRRHHDPAVRAATSLWWEHVLRYSRRDQLSAVAALRQAGLDVLAHEVDNFHSEVHEWPRHAFRTPRPVPAPGPESLVADLRAQLEQSREESAGHLAAAQELERQLADLETQLRARDRALLSSAHTVADTDAHVEALRAQLAELTASRSWRVTGPLRRLGDLRPGRRRRPH